MSPYSQTLATARLDALEALVQALKDAETPDEKRRCAVAIFNAPDPCELDDTVEWADDAEEATNSDRATDSPAALSGQPVPACNYDIPSSDPATPRDFSAPCESTPPPRPNSFPNHPELAHLSDDQILHADSTDLINLMLAARSNAAAVSGGTGGLPASVGAPGP